MIFNKKSKDNVDSTSSNNSRSSIRNSSFKNNNNGTTTNKEKKSKKRSAAEVEAQETEISVTNNITKTAGKGEEEGKENINNTTKNEIQSAIATHISDSKLPVGVFLYEFPDSTLYTPLDPYLK